MKSWSIVQHIVVYELNTNQCRHIKSILQNYVHVVSNAFWVLIYICNNMVHIEISLQTFRFLEPLLLFQKAYGFPFVRGRCLKLRLKNEQFHNFNENIGFILWLLKCTTPIIEIIDRGSKKFFVINEIP